jgi:hypothetical protein
MPDQQRKACASSPSGRATFVVETPANLTIEGCKMRQPNRTFWITLVLALTTGGMLAASVQNIREDGTSSSGKTMYEVTCSNGKTYRIYFADGQWHEGFLGAVGGQSRNLEQQAAQMCN